MKPGVGLVNPSPGEGWLGGQYVAQHFFLNANALPVEERIPFHDVWAGDFPANDPLAEIRNELGEPVVIRTPRTRTTRVAVAVRRRLHGQTMTVDALRAAGVDVLFPVSLFDDDTVRFVFLLPDFQYHHLRDVNDERAQRYFEERARREASRAKRVVVTSDAVMKDLQQLMPEFAAKTHVIFPRALPTRAWFERDPAEVATALQLPPRYFHVSNQTSAHKNHLAVARAVRILADRGVEVNVVCTGLTNDYRDPAFFPALQRQIEELGIAPRFRFLGVRPRAEQIAIMRGAVAVVQPSRFEGWGAAMAESQTLGKPLIASDLPVHHEHGAKVFRWVEPADVEGWAAALRDADRELAGGVDAQAEEEAGTQALSDARERGRALVALFREAVR